MMLSLSWHQGEDLWSSNAAMSRAETLHSAQVTPPLYHACLSGITNDETVSSAVKILQFQTRLLSGHADEIFSSFLHLACAFPYLLASYLEFDRGLLCLLQVNSRLKLDLPGARPAPASRSRPQVRANSRKRLPASALTPPMLLA